MSPAPLSQYARPRRDPADHGGRPGRALRLSVVVPTFNEDETIAGCLAALMAQTVAPFEIVVVDNMSTDDTVVRVESMMQACPSIRMLHQSDLQGLIPTRNHGFDHAHGEVIARIDADTIVSSDWVESLVHLFATGPIAAATGPVGYYDLPLAPLNRSMDDWSRRALLNLDPKRPFLFGSNMAITRAAWTSIRDHVCGDAKDLFHEDIDLALHLTEQGLRIAYAPEVTATVSARSAGRSRTAFADYTRRFDRTLDAHGVTRSPLRVAGVLLRLAYPALHRARARHRSRRSTVSADR